MIVNFIAIAVAAVIVYRAVDEVMEPLSRSRVSDDELLAMLGRFLRVMGGTTLLVLALVALALGRAA